jgi:hypothetical protein
MGAWHVRSFDSIGMETLLEWLAQCHFYHPALLVYHLETLGTVDIMSGWCGQPVKWPIPLHMFR